jgi:hypothetical protein
MCSHPSADAGPRAERDSEEALDFVMRHATTHEVERCGPVLTRNTQMHWHRLARTYAACIEPGWGSTG